MKTCKKCKEAKPLDQFGKNSRQADGLNYYCKKCESKRAAAYRHSGDCPHCGKPNKRVGEACDTCSNVYSNAWAQARASGASMVEAKKYAKDELISFVEAHDMVSEET